MSNDKKHIEIEDFLNSISSCLKSKYIMVDRSISNILYAIANNKCVYNAVAECMVNFDFRQEWQNATASSRFIKLPSGLDERIAFIFCMLNNIDDKNLDITNLLDKYYSYEMNVTPYELFCKNVIVEFKMLILKKLGLKAEPETATQSEPEDISDFSLLSNMLNGFVQYILVQKKFKHCFLDKESLAAVVSTFAEVAKNKQVEYFYSYRVMINSAIQKNKDLKNKFAPIDELAERISRR